MIIFFDLDDTLMDHASAMRSAAIGLHSMTPKSSNIDEFILKWLQAQRRYYPRYLNGELSYQETSRLRIREAIANETSDEEADKLFSDYLKLYRSEWKLFPDALPCLDRLTACTLGVITNGPSSEQRSKIRILGIEDRFQHIVVSEEVGHAKPDPRIFHHACELTAAPSSEVIYVGDVLEIDIHGACNAGLRGIWLNRHETDGQTIDAEMVTSLFELSNLIESKQDGRQHL